MKQDYRMTNTAAVKLRQQLKDGGCASKLAGVHAITDVTGFGLMGQGRELAPVSRVTVEIVVDEVPHVGRPRCQMQQLLRQPMNGARCSMIRRHFH
jgi:selenophosphate synthase